MRNDNTANFIPDDPQLAYDIKRSGQQEISSHIYSEENYSGEKILNYKDMSDNELVRQYVGQENEDAFNEIVNRYGWNIHRLAFRITHDMSAADDVMQEVFIVLFQKLDTFRSDAKFSTWLYKIATNMCFVYLRKQRRRSHERSIESYITYDNNGYFEGVQLEDWDHLPENMVIRKDIMEQIENALSEMSEIYRTVFHLSEIEGFTNKEVAGVLGLTLPAVKSRIRRARLFLRDRIQYSQEIT